MQQAANIHEDHNTTWQKRPPTEEEQRAKQAYIQAQSAVENAQGEELDLSGMPIEQRIEQIRMGDSIFGGWENTLPYDFLVGESPLKVYPCMYGSRTN